MSSNQQPTPTTGGATTNTAEAHGHTGYDERHQVPTIQG